MKFISSDDHNSLLRDSNDGIKDFKWDRLFGELSRYMPTCVSLLLSLISGKDDSQRVMLVCVIISMLLKKGSQRWDYYREQFLFYCMVMAVQNRYVY